MPAEPDTAVSSPEPSTPTVADAGDQTPVSAEPVTPAGGGDEGDKRVRGVDLWRAARSRRRALRAEVRRFTARSRRRRIAWISAAAALVLLVVVTVGAAYSPLFAVEQIRVVGTDRLDADSVEQALSAQEGVPLPLVDESAIKQALVAFPLVESYTVEARPPHELLVRIVERTPIGAIQTDAGWSVVDAAGVVLETVGDRPEAVPSIDAGGGTSSAAFESIARVMRALPDDVRGQVTAVAATTRDDVTLTLAPSGARVLWGSVDETAEKATVLASAMIARPPDTVSSYDVSSPNAIVIR